MKFVWLLVALGLLVAVSLATGPVTIPARALMTWLAGQADSQTQLVLSELRLPRTIMAVLSGATLAVGGAVMQSLFRNPLAEPGLVGVSAGAALGAVGAMALGVTSYLLVGAAGFVGALLATALAWQFARGWPGSAGLLLAGVAINALVFSLISMLVAFASDTQIRSMTFWSLGSMSRAPWTVVLVLSVWIPAGLWWIYRRWSSLNALLIGEVQAGHVGVNVSVLRVSLIVAMAVLVGPLVAFTGAISFVGLLVPQFVRRVFGSDHRQLLPLAAVFGAIVVLAADIVARLLLAPAELPIGVVVSLVGAPAFLWLLRRPLA
ncbi:MAG: iron ABC transporter permease [Burkholderiaceae bacterium]|nr:iron ABC transporter permease [Burkholderiaceae bacterium]MCD8516614.1 iron ABC transporter permease [Burkholderiaceae bacterium]MCD8538035.1 iron ABC transporter permease [Burkholderiaceae bacterium]MCD8564812.1 iron ABC transporter permease [Burkholderiaceae bacterium]